MITFLTSLAFAAPKPAPPPPPIIDRPVTLDEARVRGTLEYLRLHVDPARADITFVPRAVVLHWTAVPTLEGSFAVFAPSELAGRPELAGAGNVNVSAHFLVDRDGTIYRLLPETVVARHAIGLNDVAIGIENVGGGPDHPLTPEQVAANAALVRYLADRYPIRYVLGHSEYQRMEGTRLFHELDPTYRTEKPDPGAAFLEAVRTAIDDLNLRAPPR